jgi:hypothetical protein
MPDLRQASVDGSATIFAREVLHDIKAPHHFNCRRMAMGIGVSRRCGLRVQLNLRLKWLGGNTICEITDFGLIAVFASSQTAINEAADNG